ncbi:hypothetical protein [Legionella pneumophila]|uniref:hypothetical protein n=1 Tax=Legionella pneumophila TaxID=446 RepID=UPI0005C42E8C|nr:hypothetical protein [Legionella pneumophila]GAN29916.1 hypothetical protein lpymt_01511 [Legionella pneumophila]
MNNLSHTQHLTIARFPEFMVKCSQKAYTGTGYYVISIVVLIIGILLITHGFYLFSH